MGEGPDEEDYQTSIKVSSWLFGELPVPKFLSSARSCASALSEARVSNTFPLRNASKAVLAAASRTAKDNDFQPVLLIYIAAPSFLGM
jgi:hypothetical protein